MAGIIPKRQLDDIRFRNDVVDVLGNVLTLKKAGATFKALCPFHKEKTPSFIVNPQRQIYHCFGCGAGGNVFAFIMQYEGVDFVTAARMLADRAGIQLELADGDSGADRSEKQKLYDLHEEIAAFYRRCLEQMKTATAAREYVEKRGIDPDTVQAFGLGYAPNRWDSTLQWARKHKVAHELLARAGLIIPRSEDDPSAGYYDRFRNRLMFPITDLQGRVIGFSARALSSEERAKYINSPETPLFRKGHVLYALDKARRTMVDTREAIVCEGQIDVIRCHQAGFTAAVASQGTAFTDEHAQLLRRYADSVVVVFDSDRAGQDAAVKTATIFMGAGLGVRIAVLPEGEDPDSYIRSKGAEAFGRIVKGAVSAIDFQIDVLSAREDIRSDVGAMRVAGAVLDTIACSPNAVQQARLLQTAAERLSIPVAALQEQLRRRRRPREGTPDRAGAPAGGQSLQAAPRVEVLLCEHLAQADRHPEVADLVRRYLPTAMFTHPHCRTVAEAALACAADGTLLQDRVGSEDDRDPVLQAFAAGILMAPERVCGDEVAPADAVRDLILRMWILRLTEQRKGLLQGGTPDDDTSARFTQLTADLDSLKTWDAGVDVIEMALESDQ